jgi:hypothetical protein
MLDAFTVVIGVLGTVAYITFRKRRSNNEIMEERTIDAKPVLNVNRPGNAKIVIVKLPALTIPTEKHDFNDNDSIMTPVSSPHISQ